MRKLTGNLLVAIPSGLVGWYAPLWFSLTCLAVGLVMLAAAFWDTITIIFQKAKRPSDE